MRKRLHLWEWGIKVRFFLRKKKVNGLYIFWNEKSGWEEKCILKASMDLGELEEIYNEGPHATTIGK